MVTPKLNQMSRFENYDTKTTEEKIRVLEEQVAEDRYYLEYGGMGNQQKIKQRKRSIRECNIKLIELRKLN